MTNKWPMVTMSVLAAGLALAAGPAAALGLGQIQVKSRGGQPLLAEIPIISNDPRELEQLQAGLASPETFRRIGLAPPQGVVSGLQFTVALDARGQPVVRVTSNQPVTQPLLTFLVEVDWGQGRLVREYSALIDTPESAAAVVQPSVQAPVVAPSNTIVRPPVVVTTVPVPEPVPAQELPPAPPAQPDPPPPPPPPPPRQAPPPAVAVPRPTEVPRSTTAIPVPAPVAVPSPPVKRPPPIAVPAPPPSAPAPRPPASLAPVRPGQTLSQIARQVELPGISLDQAMLALLRANPDAFIDDNINLLRQGAVLRVPARDELSQLDPAQARAIVRAQTRSWRDARQPPAVPEVADRAAAPAAPATAATAAPARAAEARLEIVPPGGDGNTPGTRSGLSAGGEGEMLRNQLQQTKEDLAARNAEVEELRARVAELEQLQEKQQQLITLKDSELASAQQNLAENRTQTATAPATTQGESPQAPADATQAGVLPWVLGGLGLLVLAALAWLLSRRRRAASTAPVARRSFDAEALAAGMAVPPQPGAPPEAPPVAAASGAHAQMAPESAGHASSPVSEPPGTMPTWHAGTRPAEAPATPAMQTSWTGTGLSGSGEAATASERLELARAYLDTGDTSAARSLLQGLVDDSDPQMRAEATRLLQDAG